MITIDTEKSGKVYYFDKGTGRYKLLWRFDDSERAAAEVVKRYGNRISESGEDRIDFVNWNGCLVKCLRVIRPK